MVQKAKQVIISSREVIFQLVLHGLVFTFYVFDSDHPDNQFSIQPYHFVFFLNYAAANALISYVFLPQFYYKKKYWEFIGFTLLIIASVIFVEEFFLEKIFFPTSRGASFPGVLFTLAQVLPIIVILSGFKFAWDALTKQRQVDELQAIIKESELQFLKSQINPHFLFNNLNNLYSYAVENSPKTPTIILELSSVLRYMLYECREKYVSLSKEIEQLKSFTELYELQIEDRGEVKFNVQNINGEYMIAPLILSVFVENAFKHSQTGQTDHIKINIDIQLTDDGQLAFQCKNNFLPMMNENNDSKGIGLENVKKRLELLYPNAHKLSIKQTDQQYDVYLTMKLKKAV